MPEQIQKINAHICKGCGLVEVDPPQNPGSENCGDFERATFHNTDQLVERLAAIEELFDNPDGIDILKVSDELEALTKELKGQSNVES